MPRTLDETYERTLRDIDDANWELAHCLFQCVSVASRPLRVEELTEFLAFDFETAGVDIPKFLRELRPEDPVDAVLSTCRSLLAVVDVDGSRVIQFSHFSVKEFLTSARLAESIDTNTHRYHVSMRSAHTLVARACLGMLLHLDETVTSGILETYPLAEYASLHWLGHARSEDVSANLQGGMKRLFDPSRRHLAVWLWVRDLKTTFWRRPERSEKPSTPRGQPLHYAAVCGLYDIVKFLVDERGQVVDARGFYKNETPLSSASRSGQLEVVKVLLGYDADARAQDERKSTPLHRASEGGHLNVVQVLIRYGADVKAQDADMSTPLHGASQGGHLDVAQVLLEKGADARAQDIDSSTPLHWASQGGHLDIVQLLLEHGADARAEDGVKSTPLHAAAQGGHLDVTRVLLEHGADARAEDEDKWTPLHRASENGHLDVVRLLLLHGADARAPDIDKWTPLHRASQRGHLSVARVLLENGAVAGAPTKQKWTPLHWASQGGHLGVTRVLLDHGADARAQTKHKWTPLHWASERGHLEIARVLLEHGADASAQNDKNWTPFQEASENGRRGIMQLLLEHGAVELGFNQYGIGVAT
jgi:ankyrin repeat protein